MVSLGAAHRGALARHAKAVRQLELGLCALHPAEQAWGLGCCLEPTDKPRVARQRRACYRFDGCAGASTCSRRKSGNQENQALGRSRGGFSTEVHLRTNAKGEPLTFELTGGEAHEVKGYEALMKLFDTTPERLIGDKGYDRDKIRSDLAKRGTEPVIPPRSNRTNRLCPKSLQAAKPHRAVRQLPQAVPANRHPLRKNCQNLSLIARAGSHKALDENCQHGLTTLKQLSQWKLYI